MAQEQPLLVEHNESICTLTINRPSRRNVLTPDVLLRLADTLKELGEDGRTRVIVLRGAGEQAFSAGYDIGQIPPGEELLRRNPLDEATSAVEACPVPVIAMIHGFCVGGGLDLAVSCDLRLAADTSRLGITPAKLGLVYHASGVLRFLNLVGVSRTKELFSTGRLIDAASALQMGLVNQVTPATNLARRTYELAQEIAENAPLAVRGTKLTVARLLSYQAPRPEVLEELLALQREALNSEDRQEGQRAFQEKRKPRFLGS